MTGTILWLLLELFIQIEEVETLNWLMRFTYAAACFDRPAWDGSPITCYCPVYKSIKYLVGSPLTANSTCKPMLVRPGSRSGT